MLFQCTGEVAGSKGEKVILKPVHPIKGDDKAEILISTWILTPLFPKQQFLEGQVFEITASPVNGEESKPVTEYRIDKAEATPLPQ